jgi:phosphatidylserine/phosphatidylglycerophosphate/cardiolipin synthase-like enzyme
MATARPGDTCWRIARAERVATLVDAEEYFTALRGALERARSSILILGWDFDPRTELAPNADGTPSASEIGGVLQQLARSRPQLSIHLLIWDMVLPLSILHFGYPQRSRSWFDARIQFELDATHPPGACHHQKIVVIDDSVAFCGGTDLSTDRWDSTGHEDANPRRRLPSGQLHPPRHDLMMMVDGEAARVLGELARTRWQDATGTRLEPTTAPTPDAWPAHCAPHFTHVDVAVARTQPEYDGHAAVTENLRLHLNAIASATRLIYFENQYIVSPEIENALAARLAETSGPEIVIVCGSHSPSYFDRFAIDDAQHRLLETLRNRDRFNRFRALTPVTAGGEAIIVHSKVSIIDDRLLRVGSTNLNNRSLGFDTECDLAVEADAEAADVPRVSRAIAAVRDRLFAHHLDVPVAAFVAARARHGRFIAAVESFSSARLRPIHTSAPRADDSPIRSLIAEYHLGDPRSVDDAWRPWKRI